MKQNAPEKDFGWARSWKETGKGEFIPMDIRHFPFLSLNTRFPLTAPSPLPAADICFFVPLHRAASPTLPLYSCWKSNDSAHWKQGAENLPAKVCVGPSPHPGLEVAPSKLGHAPAVPFVPLSQQLSASKNRVFPPKTEVANDKGETRPSILTMFQ